MYDLACSTIRKFLSHTELSCDQFLSCTVSYCRSEYSAFWRCVKAGAAYLVTQLCKVKTDSSRVE